MTQPLLQLENLNVAFDTDRGQIRPVRDVSLSIFPGQTVAVVGESGCGKSVTAMSILRLIPQPPGKVLGGSIRLEGRDLLALPEREMRRVRGEEIALALGSKSRRHGVRGEGVARCGELVGRTDDALAVEDRRHLIASHRLALDGERRHDGPHRDGPPQSRRGGRALESVEPAQLALDAPDRRQDGARDVEPGTGRGHAPIVSSDAIRRGPAGRPQDSALRPARAGS